MKRETASAINRRLLDKLKKNTTDQAPHEIKIAAEAFSCPEIFSAEKSLLFHNTPQPVAFSAEIAEPGSFMALDVLDIPILLTRADSGQLNAFVNKCSHRGAKVAHGCGQRQRLVCRFHGWAYSLDGKLQGRPQEECFTPPRRDCALPRLPVSEKYGIVVVGINRTMPQDEVDSALEEIGEEVGNFHLERYRKIDRQCHVVKANWKLVNDLSLESYHFNTVHRDSVARLLLPNAVVDTFGRHSRWAFPLKSISRLNDLHEDEWPDGIEGSCTYTLYPGVMIIINASGAQMIRAEPGIKPAESRVVYAGICATGCDMKQAGQAYIFGGDVFTGEDLPLAEECQQGLEADGQYLLLGRNEPLLQFWHRLWEEAVQ